MPTQSELRGLFEAWVREYDGDLSRDGDGYADTDVHACWVAWQAAFRAGVEASAMLFDSGVEYSGGQIDKMIRTLLDTEQEAGRE